MSAARTGSHFGREAELADLGKLEQPQRLSTPRPSAAPQRPVGAGEDELVEESVCQRRIFGSGTSCRATARSKIS
jgi:hypothetical protein